MVTLGKALELVTKDGYLLEEVSEEFKKDREIVLAQFKMIHMRYNMQMCL